MNDTPASSSIGIDLVEVDEVRRSLERQPGLRTRVFTEAEWDYASTYPDPLPHLAARFAAKEAVMKALGRGMGAMSFGEIEVTRDSHGAPGVVLRGRALDLANSQGVLHWSLSLSHTRRMAQAVALAMRVPVPVPVSEPATESAALGELKMDAEP